MEENKKSGGGDVRSASHPTHIPRRPKKKVGYAEINCAYRSYRVYRSYGGYTIEGIALRECGGGNYYMRRRFFFVVLHKSGQLYPFLNERAVPRRWHIANHTNEAQFLARKSQEMNFGECQFFGGIKASAGLPIRFLFLL